MAGAALGAYTFAKPFLAAPNPLLVVVSLVPVVAALSQVWADRLALATAGTRISSRRTRPSTMGIRAARS